MLLRCVQGPASLEYVYINDQARQGLHYLAGEQYTGAVARLAALLFGKRVGFDSERAALLLHLVKAGHLKDLAVEDARSDLGAAW